MLVKFITTIHVNFVFINFYAHFNYKKDLKSSNVIKVKSILLKNLDKFNIIK